MSAVLFAACLWYFLKRRQRSLTPKEKVNQIPRVLADVKRAIEYRKRQLLSEKKSLERDEKEFKKASKMLD
jgi:hypothetical protein